MSKRIHFFIFVFLLLYGIGGLLAQDSLVSLAPKKPEQSVEWMGEGYINSNTITNNFIRAFYDGGLIDDRLKENASKRISSVNRLGAASKFGFTYLFHSEDGKNKPEFSFSFFDRTHVSLKFPEDLFYTVFYGNKRYAGKTASLGNLKFNFLRYQQFRFGWDWKGKPTHADYGFAVSILSGDQNKYINVQSANLFTAWDGTFMDLNMKMNMAQTDAAHRTFFSQNGMGLSTDFYYQLSYTAWKNPGKITMEVRDLGFIRWKNNSMHHSVDSSFHYEGVEVSDIFHLTGSSVSPSIDTILDKNTSFVRKQYISYIPFTLSIHTKVFYGKRLVFEKGITWLLNASAKPYYYAKLHFILGRKKSFDLACPIGYGGYGGFNAGLDAKVDFAKHYSFHLADNYLFSGITSHTSCGMGVYAALVRRF